MPQYDDVPFNVWLVSVFVAMVLGAFICGVIITSW